jgi:phospholipid transport system transporter-binding protein
VITLPSRLTADEAPSALKRLQAASSTAADAAWVIDASQLQEFDSAALALLLAYRRAAQAQGKTLELRHAPPKLMALARLYGLDVLLLNTPGPAVAS